MGRVGCLIIKGIPGIASGSSGPHCKIGPPQLRCKLDRQEALRIRVEVLRQRTDEQALFAVQPLLAQQSRGPDQTLLVEGLALRIGNQKRGRTGRRRNDPPQPLEEPPSDDSVHRVVLDDEDPEVTRRFRNLLLDRAGLSPSEGVEQPIPRLALSNGIRSAVIGWSKTLASEVANQGITVNVVLPGRIHTERVDQLDKAAADRSNSSVEAVAKASMASIPAGRYGRPQEFADVVTFLASERASYVTGSKIRIDGGATRSI